MKLLLTFVLTLLFVTLAFAKLEDIDSEDAFNNTYTEKKEFKGCPRSLDAKYSKNSMSLRVKAKKSCERKGSKNKNGALKWFVEVSNLPRMTFSIHEDSSKGGEEKAGGEGAKFQSQMVITKVFEYQETNGVEGFQMSRNGTQGDKIIATHHLSSNYNMTTGKLDDNLKQQGNSTSRRGWTPLRKPKKNPEPKEGTDSREDGSGSGTKEEDRPKPKLVIAETRLKRDKNNTFADYQMIWKWTQTEVTEEDSNASEKAVLSPNSVKFNFRMLNITYTHQNTTGIAIEVVMVNKAVMKERTKVDAESDDGEQRIDQPGGKNKAMDLPGDDGEDGGRFCFRQEVYNGTHNIGAKGNGTFDEQSNANGNIEKKSGHKAYVTYVSVPERVSNMEWDPSLGSNTADEILEDLGVISGVSQVTGSVGMVVACVLALLAMMF